MTLTLESNISKSSPLTANSVNFQNKRKFITYIFYIRYIDIWKDRVLSETEITLHKSLTNNKAKVIYKAYLK